MRPRFGQHFLRNRSAIEKILGCFNPQPGDRVVEIGAGRGALTLPLVTRVGALVAIEIEPALAESLASALQAPLWKLPKSGIIDRSASIWLPPPERGDPAAPSAGRIVLQADALEIRYADLAAWLGASETDRLRVIGNLPYSIATALLRRMIAARDLVGDAVLMVQKEVADRILAQPGRREYGFLTVLAAACAERQRLLSLEPGSFSPPPKVRSSVIALRFRHPSSGFRVEDSRLIAALRAAFSERRKKLATNLAKRYTIDRSAVEELLMACGADRSARAEDLSPETFLRLASVLPDPASEIDDDPR